MDEIDEYRERIEHRYSDRRRKNDRRQARRAEAKPIDWLLIADGLLFVGMAIAFYYLN